METVPQTTTPRNLTHIATDLLAAQSDWLNQLLAQGTASAIVPTMQAQIDAELTRRAAEHVALLASINIRPIGYLAVREWRP